MTPRLAALLLAVMTTAQAEPGTRERPAAAPTLTLETYNAGLAYGFVDYGEARREPIFDALRASEADILCMQEVWEPRDREAIEQTLGDAYPYRVITEVEQRYAAEAPACGITELFGEGRFVSCMTGECGDAPDGDEKTNCIIDKCGGALTDLKNSNRDCAQALMAQVGKSAPMALWTVVRPFWNAGVYAYGGSNGLVMLSRRELKDVETLDFSDIATLNRRQALAATVEHDGVDVRVYCTHLSADLTHIAPYPGTFPTWADENMAQVERLLASAAEHEGPVALMGDFNCGRADKAHKLIGEAERSCQAIVDAGYSDPAAEIAPIECTWCESNLLNLEGGEHDEVVIDHIFLRDLDVASEGRTFDQEISVEIDGAPHKTSLSDHFGYAAAVTRHVEPPPEEEVAAEGDAGARVERPAAGQRPTGTRQRPR